MWTLTGPNSVTSTIADPTQGIMAPPSSILGPMGPLLQLLCDTIFLLAEVTGVGHPSSLTY